MDRSRLPEQAEAGGPQIVSISSSIEKSSTVTEGDNLVNFSVPVIIDGNVLFAFDATHSLVDEVFASSKSILTISLFLWLLMEMCSLVDEVFASSPNSWEDE